jgi:hypothetical protein
LRSYPVATGRPWAGVREPAPHATPSSRLLDRVREAIRARHYSRRTEKTYVHWIKRYIFFHGKRHPLEMRAPEVTAFLGALAVQGRVAASTQNQALSALLFLYRDVLAVGLTWLDDVVRAKRPQHLPVVLTLATRCARSFPSWTGPRVSWRSCSTGRDFACSNAATFG